MALSRRWVLLFISMVMLEIADKMGQDPSAEKSPVVALLTPSGFDAVVTFFALNRLGYAVLFLSTRLTAPAYARLMGMADCNTIIAAASFSQVTKDISVERTDTKTLPMLRREDYRGHVAAPPFQRAGVDSVKEGNKMAWILHSSGSTGFPKPIYLTNLQCLANFRKSFGMRAFCTSPLFHSQALMELGRAFYARAPMYIWNYNHPITSMNVIEAMGTAKPKLFGSVPYVLKLLAEKPEGIRPLAKAEIVLFGGSSCPDDLGDRLVAEGVNLVGNYGATETGQIMTSFRPPGDTEWQYLRLHRPVADHTLMDEIAPGVFECVGLDGLPSKGPSNSKPPYSDKNPENSFRTADLFTRHPDPAKSNYWKYLSRLDDRITLVNGEKVLPIPIEGGIRQEDIVREAVVFGYQRTVPGVLIFRSDQHGLNLTDQEFLEQIWPAIEKVNASAESFSRIPKDLVVIKGADVTYPRTDKGTCIRAQVYEQFADDIKQAYRSFEAGSEQGGGLQLDLPGLESWLLEKFRHELSIPLPNAATDIFSAGVDSLQTTRIWRMIKKDLDLGKGGKSMSQNVVFEKGTVKALAAYLYALRTGKDVDEEEDQVEVMRQLINKYSTFTQHFPSSNTIMPEKETIVVTGATGNLGAFLLATLARRPSVSAIYALVRAPGPAAAGHRVLQSLASRNIHLSPAEQRKLHALPSDLSQPNLGLDQHILEHLLATATTVIHSAWAVNFNLPVRSFEEQHIRGTYNLLNFCLRSRLPQPAKLFFCSSVSAASGTPKPATIPETAVEELAHAQKMGYGRSKLVTEHIVWNCTQKTGMEARVLRIGQLSGDSASGIWNDTEAIALMVRSALTTGCLPSLEESPSWLPVDVCADVVAELALSTRKREDGDRDGDSDANLVYHVLNPRTFSFRSQLLPCLSKHPAMPPFNVVSPAEWLDALARSEPDAAKNPSIKLLDFWRGKYGSADGPVTEGRDDEEAPAGLTFETGRTVRACSILGEVRDPVSEGLMGRYVDVWMRKWRAEV